MLKPETKKDGIQWIDFQDTVCIGSVEKSGQKFRGPRESEVAGPFLPYA